MCVPEAIINKNYGIVFWKYKVWTAWIATVTYPENGSLLYAMRNGFSFRWKYFFRECETCLYVVEIV